MRKLTLCAFVALLATSCYSGGDEPAAGPGSEHEPPTSPDGARGLAPAAGHEHEHEHEHAPGAGAGVGEDQSAPDYINGELIYEIEQSATARVRYYQQASGAVLSEISGHAELDSGLMALHRQAAQTTDPVAHFKILAPNQQVPKVLQDAALRVAEYAKRALHANAELLQTVDNTPVAQGLGVSSVSQVDVATRGPGARLQSHAVPSAESWWDWEGDAAWWRDNFCSLYPNKHFHKCITNHTWATSGSFCGPNLSAQGIAASHVSGARFKGWVTECSQCWLIGTCCDLEVEWDVNLQPRHYKMYSRSNSGNVAVEIWGKDPNPRMHVSYQVNGGCSS